jgi:hypothetical protein
MSCIYLDRNGHESLKYKVSVLRGGSPMEVTLFSRYNAALAFASKQLGKNGGVICDCTKTKPWPLVFRKAINTHPSKLGVVRKLPRCQPSRRQPE